jgi:hypothetical protein
MEEEERKTIEKILERLLIAVEEQKYRIGYYFFGGVNNGL